jgi:hypothetical protein
LKDEPKPSFNQVPLFVSHTLTSDRIGIKVHKDILNLIVKKAPQAKIPVKEEAVHATKGVAHA